MRSSGELFVPRFRWPIAGYEGEKLLEASSGESALLLRGGLLVDAKGWIRGRGRRARTTGLGLVFPALDLEVDLALFDAVRHAADQVGSLDHLDEAGQAGLLVEDELPVGDGDVDQGVDEGLELCGVLAELEALDLAALGLEGGGVELAQAEILAVALEDSARSAPSRSSHQAMKQSIR